MGLSRLDNFLKSSRGTILYVNPNDLDATDSIENQGNSLTRPFKTIQRALIEASRFSYQRGLNNDRFGKTTILLYPGDHIVDNRPGYIPDGVNLYRTRSGAIVNDLPPYDLTSNLSLDSPENELFKLNSIHGGVIVPRGTSIVGLDLRKTKVRPKYVPDPENDNIERSALFRITGACYFWQFTMFDSDPNGVCYKDYTKNQFVPNFSHHKLTCFEYADGTNNVEISDTFQSFSTDRTDLDMYYEKISLVYGQSSGRAISPDYPSSGLDIQAKIDEHRIVGSTGVQVGITSIKAGDGATSSTTITVTTATEVPGLDVDTPFRISGITASGYTGQFVVSDKVDSTNIKYQVQNEPTNPLPSITGSSLQLQSDTVTSASPYIFNLSLRSVFGMCGMHADGSKATGFKSMVVAQFTGIGLQKDDNAFVKYNATTGNYEDNTVAGNEILSTDSRAVYKPSYKNFHIKCSNNSVIQAVSIFAIGYAEHFVSETGGDQSITNSNSNFGAKALIADGFRKDAFSQDDVGYFTHFIPPKEIPLTETSIEFDAIDVLKTGRVPNTGIGSTGNLYLFDRTNKDAPPENVIDGFRVGAKTNDTLKVLVSSAGSVTEYGARIVMPNSQSSSEKIFLVNRSATGINSIGVFSSGGATNVITLTANHTFLTGETVRVISDTGQIPDGLESNQIYHAIVSGLDADNLKLAKTFNDAVNGNAITINEKGGILKVSSRVTDKNAGEVGHPIQYDDTNNQWYVNVSTAATDNTLFPIVVGFGSTGFGDATPRSFITRRNDNRNANDTLYRARYVIPASSGGSIARPPVEGFVIQESNTSIGSSTAEIQTYFGSGSIANINQQRNFRFIAGATFSAGAKTASFTTELPHDLTVGSLVQINNIKSANNTTGAGNSGFNYTANVTGISSSKHFTVGLGTDPGLFTSDTTTRNTSLPNFKKKEYDDTLYVYRVEEAQKYVSGEQDGVYYLTVVTANEKPSVAPFTNEKYSQPVKSLFPQTQRDDPEADPQESRSFARSALIGDVVVNDPRKSLTKEAANRYFKANDIGIGITEIVSTNGLTHNVTSTLDHGLNRIVTLGITNAGAGYGAANTTLYNATLAPTVGAAETVVGKHATAKITTGSSGEITAVTVMDGGSAYGIGNSMFVTGVSTFTGFSSAIVTVTGIYNNVGDTLRITGVNSEGFASYNQLYRITEVPVGGATSITVAAASTVGGHTSTGIGATAATGAFAQLTGESVAIDVSSFAYNKDVGIATLTTSGQKHVFATGQRITLQGATSNLYNGSFVVSKVNSLTQFELKVGISTNTPSLAVDAPDFGAFRAFHEGLSANDGVITNDSENLNGRMIPTYAGITTTLSAAMINATTEEMNIVEITKLDFRIGDYLLVDDELVRIKDQVSGNPLRVFRGVLGTRPTSHVIDSVVRRVLINPVELRRHSINRASGHTFEYVGYGPGNYSTALPDRQDRTIGADEELLAQSLKRQGGINFYTGMNDRGISYSGNKKLSTITGREEIFDTPFQTIEGEDISTLPSLNVVTPVEGRFARSVNVEGGADNKVSSSFNGPVIINNKLTVNSPLETNSIFIQGDATVSRKHTVGIATPILAGNPGDLVYSANPSEGDYVGWIYSTQNEWRRFGATSLFTDQNIMIFDKVGIGTTTPGEATFKVGAGSTQLVVDGDGVGIGTTANGFDLRVQGNTNISGNINAGIITGTFLHGNGAAITNVNVSAAGWTNSAGVLYNTALGSVGIGTSASAVNLTVGDRHENTGAGQSTSLFVFGNAIVAGLVTCRDFIPVGVITATSFDFDSGIDNAGRIRAGIATLGVLHVGAGGTIITTTNAVGLGSVGINSTVPSADLDVNGRVFFKTYSERVGNASLAAQVATVDLSEAQTFICTATSNITHFTLKNAPSGSTSFTIKVEQDSTGSRSIDIDDFRTVGGVAIPVFWPGGVVPTPTTTASRTDIYSFKIFNGDNPTSSGLYGVVGGQNFQN